MEFGYISEGEAKSREEKDAILQTYGFANEKHVKQHIEEFVENLPKRVKDVTKDISEEDVTKY